MSQSDIPDFVCCDDNDAIIRAEQTDTALIPWRIDGHGRLWYRRLPTIRAIPRDESRIDGGDDD